MFTADASDIASFVALALFFGAIVVGCAVLNSAIG